MPKFNYVAMDSRGKETKGTLEVGNNVQVNPTLNIGTASEHVEVQSAGVSVETERMPLSRRSERALALHVEVERWPLTMPFRTTAHTMPRSSPGSS